MGNLLKSEIKKRLEEKLETIFEHKVYAGAKVFNKGNLFFRLDESAPHTIIIEYTNSLPEVKRNEFEDGIWLDINLGTYEQIENALLVDIEEEIERQSQ